MECGSGSMSKQRNLWEVNVSKSGMGSVLRISRWNSVFACMVAGSLLAWQTQLEAQSLDEAFAEAIEAAQARTVKVYGAGAGRVEAYASGILISADGKILTRQGVFLEGHRVRVTLPDGTTHQATVLKRNRRLKAAVLQVSVETPEYFELSDQEVARKGDWVVALSNAFKVADGEEPLTVTLGIVTLRSTIDARLNQRDVAYSGPIVLIDCITSNPGAAGGAVINSEGQLVGMVGTVIKSSETNTRLNYAVPSSELLKFVNGEFDGDGNVEGDAEEKPKGNADLGLKLFELAGEGEPAYVDRVRRGGPAAAIGMRPDDLVISLDGQKTASVRDFKQVLGGLTAGREVIIIFKRGAELIRVPVTPVEAADK